jgi:hypothetical protein
MATSNNVLLKKMTGHIGKQLVVRQYGDQTVVSKYPDMSRRKLSPKQVKVNETMSKANYRARGIIANETMRNEAQLRLNVTRNKLYTALVREYFKNESEAEGKGTAAK